MLDQLTLAELIKKFRSQEKYAKFTEFLDYYENKLTKEENSDTMGQDEE